jgi:uncharacterized membrane protein YgcG
MSRLRPLVLSAPCIAVAALALLASGSPASAAQPGVGLGTATSYAVLAGSGVSNTGSSVISGDVGTSPNNAVVGFPPGLVNNGVIHAADAQALQAKNDLVTGYNDAAGRLPRVDKTGQDLGGQTLLPGVYNASTAMALTGTVTLDGLGDPAAVFIFQAGSTLDTATNSTVSLIGAALPCNVFWQVGSSATLGTNSVFVGSILALTSITATTGATIQGRLLARNGAVTLDTNTITRPACATTPTSSVSATPSPSSSPTTHVSAGHVTLTNNGNNDNNGNNSGGSGSGGSGGSGSGGSGSSAGGGSDTTPVVPTGHPETGRASAPGDDGRYWLLGAVACLGGAAGAVARSSRRRSPGASAHA